VRVVVQRAVRAAVRATHTVGAEERRIDAGLVLLVGFAPTDDAAVVEWMADKCLALRIFPDDSGAMNCCVVEAGGSVLVIPNFTLYGDARKGRRPSFTGAAPPAQAGALFERFVAQLERGPTRVASGWFQEHMHVELVNDGPVTLVLERD